MWQMADEQLSEAIKYEMYKDILEENVEYETWNMKYDFFLPAEWGTEYHN